MTTEFTLIGRGLYTVTDAARLTGVPRRSIARWARGDVVTSARGQRVVPPLIASQLQRAEEPFLDFADLLEVQMIERFRSSGVSPRAIRLSALRAREVLQTLHPFTSRRFQTDGRSILLEFAASAGEPRLLNLVKDQYEFRRIVSSFLRHGIEYLDDAPVRWWPRGRKARVVLDPQRSMGAPIVASVGIRTSVLSSAADAEGSIAAAARWYSVPEVAVRAAVTFEGRLAA